MKDTKKNNNKKCDFKISTNYLSMTDVQRTKLSKLLGEELISLIGDFYYKNNQTDLTV